MKNKTKKLIAGLGIGLTLAGGGLMMTGCSMTEDQQVAIDNIVNKTEQIIELLDMQNNKLSQAEAFRLYEYALERLYVNKDNAWDNFKITISGTTNDEQINETFEPSVNQKYCFYTLNDNKSVFYIYSEPWSTYLDNSYENYSMGVRDRLFFATHYLFDITMDNILDCKILENGNYLLVAFGEYSNVADKILAEGLIEIEITKDAKLVNKDYTLFINGDIDEDGNQDKCLVDFNTKFEYGVLKESDVRADIEKYFS